MTSKWLRALRNLITSGALTSLTAGLDPSRPILTQNHMTDDNFSRTKPSCHGQTIHITVHLWRGYTKSPTNSPYKGPVMQCFDVSFMLSKKLLNNDTNCRRFETPLRSCDIIVIAGNIFWKDWIGWGYWHFNNKSAFHQGDAMTVNIYLGNKSSSQWDSQ